MTEGRDRRVTLWKSGREDTVFCRESGTKDVSWVFGFGTMASEEFAVERPDEVTTTSAIPIAFRMAVIRGCCVLALGR